MCFRPASVGSGPVNCPVCGGEVKDPANVTECPHCGVKVAGAGVPAPPAPPKPPGAPRPLGTPPSKPGTPQAPGKPS